MATLYRNFLSGTITDNPLTSGATTINSSNFASLPVVAAPDIMWLVLDPDAAAGAPELVKVTAHTSSATVLTVVRAQQDTTAREHLLSTIWRHSETMTDLDTVENHRLADMVQASIKGRVSGSGTGEPVDLTAAQVLTILATVANAEFVLGNYTPTLTAMAVGTGGSAENSARYLFVGGPDTGDRGVLIAWGNIVFGTSGVTFPTSPSVSLPAGFNFDSDISQGGTRRLGLTTIFDTSVGSQYEANNHWATASTWFPHVQGATLTVHSGTVELYVNSRAVLPTIPMAWAAGDGIHWQITAPVVRV